jgi:hypothetical protein
VRAGFRRNGAFAVLALLAFLAIKLGDTFGTALTIFTIFVWVIAIGMFVYVTLFKGVRLTLFSRNRPEEDLDEGFTAQEIETPGAILVDEGDIVVRKPTSE